MVGVNGMGREEISVSLVGPARSVLLVDLSAGVGVADDKDSTVDGVGISYVVWWLIGAGGSGTGEVEEVGISGVD